MNLSLSTYFIVCPLVFLAGFVDSIAGGGGLISLPAYLIAGLPPVVASATNKLSAFMGNTVSFINYYKNGFVNFKKAIPCIFIAMIFSSIGAQLQMMIPENYLKILMLVALPLTLIFVLNKHSLEDNKSKSNISNKNSFILSLLISAIMGIYDGIYGPATGTFLIIFFIKIVGFNINESNGIAKSINFATNLGALLLFMTSGRTLFLLGIIAGIFNMIGCYIGSKLFIKKGLSVVRPIMIIVMLIFLVKVIFELIN